MMKSAKGFTLIELMVAVAIIAIIGAVALFGYQEYTTRAAAADIVSAHHNIRTAVTAALGGQSADDCATIAAQLDRKALADPYATLDYGFEPVPGGGFRPVLTVCATAQGNARNVPVARRAYDSFAGMGMAEKSAVLKDTLVSFAVRLTDGDKALCTKATATTTSTCGPAQPTQAAAQPAQPVQATATAPPACPTGQVRDASGTCALPACTPDQERVSGNCVAKCATGQIRDASGTCVSPAALLPPVPQPRASQPAPTVTTAATCPAGQEKVLITSGTQAQSACAPKCQAGERRNTAGLCIQDVPPPAPTWATNAPNPGTPPPPAEPGKLPTCASGTKLVTTFVQGVLTNTCVADTCPADQKPGGSGQCVPRCTAPLIYDQLMRICIDKTSPPACPGGLARSADGQCTCASGLLPEADGSCSQVCTDSYGSTCDADFGQGMCTDPFVAGMCEKYCGLCQLGSTAVPKLGTGGAPVMPAIAPFMVGVLPRNAGETLVLDDQQLAKLFGVVSPDGSPVSITKAEFVILSGPADATSAYDIRRRDDGRWQITATSTANEPRRAFNDRPYQYADLDFFLYFTFTNAVGSTRSGGSFASSRK